MGELHAREPVVARGCMGLVVELRQQRVSETLVLMGMKCNKLHCKAGK